MSESFDLTKYTTCITNTIDKNLIKFNILLNSINTITVNDMSFMNIIIDKFVSSYKINTFDEFIFNLELIAHSTKNNLEIMLKVIQKYFIDSNFSTNKCRLTTQQQYSYWLKINQHKFVDNCDEIKYVYYKLNSMIQYTDLYYNSIKVQSIHYVDCVDTLDSFKSSQSSMSDFYNLMIQLFEKTPEIISVPRLKVVNNKLADNKLANTKLTDTIDDEFHDASDKKSSDENSNENSNKYNDSDTVYKKTMKNTKTRTQRRVNTGK